MKITLSDKDKSLIRVLQEGLPVTSTPYREIAQKAGWDTDLALQKIDELKKSGVIRRICAFVKQSEVGYDANGMVVWNVPDHKVDEIGPELAKSDLVSHCYTRPRNEKFPFNVYTMMHGKSRGEIVAEVQQLSKKWDISNFRILFTVRELKRSAPKFFME
jgi:siroheme decarboxylase